MSTIIPYCCPDCGAELNDLQNIIRLSSRENPKMSFRCTICESTFDVVSPHCMEIYKETRRAERFAASRNQNKISVGVTA